MVNIQNFTALKGHIFDGSVVVVPSGREYTIRSHIKGWVIVGPDGTQISGYLSGAADVEYFVINGLATH